MAATAVAALAATVLGAQGTKGVSLQPGQHGPRLLIDVNGKGLNEWTVTSLPDTVTLTVSPQDSLGNSIPLTGYEIQVWDEKVLAIAGTAIGSNQAVSKLVPGKRGQTTIQIRASGIRQWVLVELGPSTLGIGPRPAPMARGESNNLLIAGGRLSYAGYSYSFNNQATFNGKGGVVGEAFIGRDYNFGLVLVLGLGFGVLKADSLATGSATPMEWEAFLRGDWVFLRDKKWRPVVSLGTGGYRIRTGHNGGIWNTSIFWTAGAGVDYMLGPRTVGEVRIGTQQLYEANSQLKNGYVGNLLVFSIGARFALK